MHCPWIQMQSLVRLWMRMDHQTEKGTICIGFSYKIINRKSYYQSSAELTIERNFPLA